MSNRVWIAAFCSAVINCLPVSVGASQPPLYSEIGSTADRSGATFYRVDNAETHTLPFDELARSHYALGRSYEYGLSVDPDDSKALFWYEKSAELGLAEAQYRLAVLHDNGWGTVVNKDRAFTLFLAAAEQGLTLAQHDIAIAFFEGAGTEKNLLQAYKWLKIADLGGSPLMSKHLRIVASEMSGDEIETASYLAQYWVERNGSK